MVSKNDLVRVTRKESYWFNAVGVVTSIDKIKRIRYPVTVKFETQNYIGANTATFSLAEILPVETKIPRRTETSPLVGVEVNS